jgi:hypothetical protein
MEKLLSARRECNDWPQQFLWLLEDAFKREQSIYRPYSGDRILIDRSQLPIPESHGEKRATYGLFHTCHKPTRRGLLSINDDLYWLISCEVPNQLSERGRRADLLGLSQSGGLCVFECKIGMNGYSPMAAILEGLDYLASLTCKSNHARIQQEFSSLLLTGSPPRGFEGVRPEVDARHEVIVLADSDYYEFHTRRPLSQHWGLLNSLRDCESPIRIGLAEASINEEGIYCLEKLQWYESRAN